MINQTTRNNFHPDTFKKEQIIRRLRNKAVQYWGLKESEADSLDPLVDMLLGACAVEFERTAQEINSSQSRLLERLAQLMVPEVYTNGRPAHAIMYAKADSAVVKLKPEDQFFAEKEIQENNKLVTIPIPFSPVKSFKVFDGAIVYQAAGNKITFYDSPLTKGKILYAEEKEMLPANTVWLGLRLNSKIASLKGMSFFFDWKNEGDKTKYLPLLSMTRWKMGEDGLELEPGLARKEGKELTGFDAMAELEGNVLQYYQRNFLTIDPGEHKVNPEKYPKAFEEIFPAEQLKELKDELVWLKVTFAGLSSQQPLQELFCSINCFPVMNRKLNLSSRPYTLTPNLNIIPVQSEDHYLAIRKVYSDTRSYRSLSFKEVREAEDGTYSVRQGGVARFDQRNSSTLLSYLYNLLRDESAAFSAFGHHALSSEIRSLEQGLTRLQMHFLQKLNEQATKCHLLLHTKMPEDVWVEFWSTQGSLANQLPVGKKLTPQTNTSVKRESLLLLSSSSGGKEPMNESEKLHAYKHTLLTRNRVVTEEDIKSACFAELGEKLEKVEIKKGFVKDLSSKKGFVSTLDVVLTPALEFRKINWREACHELQAQLERKKMFLTGIQVYAQTENQEYVSGGR